MATINGTSGNDNLVGTASDDSIYGNAGNDTLTGSGGNDILDGGLGNDSMVGGLGNDAYYIDSTSDIVVENIGEGTDTVFLSAASYNFTSIFVENIYLSGSATTVTANSLNNYIRGNDANNTISGLAGIDTIYGGNGNDTLNGGDDNDILFGDAGNDLLNGDLGDDRLNGSAGNDTINGGDGNDTISGGIGIDSMAGGLGNDVYYVDNAGDIITENSNEGIDRIFSEISFALTDAGNAANVENLALTGTSNLIGTGNSLDNSIQGNTGNNTLIGGAGNDTLNGGTGNDSLDGGSGNDIYFIDSAADVITESANNGTDTVYSYVTYSLDQTNVNTLENLILIGSATINATGNALNNSILGNDADNTLIGNEGNDLLNGGAGNDSMRGGIGNDTYYVDSDLDIVDEQANSGLDRVFSYITHTLESNVEQLILLGTDNLNATGNTLDNTVRGNVANNILDGGLGRDTMYGGAGDDIYYVDNVNDKTVELASEGTDTTITALSGYVLEANVENLIISATTSITVTGNSGDNLITGTSLTDSMSGGAGNDTLNGGAGADNMTGGSGNDIYYVDNVSDIVIENGGDANGSGNDDAADEVRSSVSWTIVDGGSNQQQEVENLTLIGFSNINGTGNAKANVITGNNNSNILDGGAGIDTLVGGDGDDVYRVDSTDVVTELADNGVDRVEASVTYTLVSNLEDLTLLGASAINGTGNSLTNTIIGNTAANTLNGLAGGDLIKGGDGNDTINGGTEDDALYGENNDDTIHGDAGNDVIYGGAGIDTLFGDTENDILYGEAGNDTLDGGAGDDTLDGGTGNDSMTGGVGNDTYYVDSASDVLGTELATAGETDTVVVSAAINYTLAANFENITMLLGGTATGNSVANVIHADNLVANGNLTGGAGNDTYYIDNDTLDTVVEAAASGTDIIYASDTIAALASNVENLTLVGSVDINATGNSAANLIIGNSGANRLTGGGGADTLQGGSGGDTYVFTNAASFTGVVITESANQGTDYIETTAASVNLNSYSNVEGVRLLGGGYTATGTTGNDFLISVPGVGNALVGGNGNDYLDSSAGGGNGDQTGSTGPGGDTLTGGEGSDIYLVSTWDDYKYVAFFGSGSPLTAPTIQDTINETGTGATDVDTMIIVWSDVSIDTGTFGTDDGVDSVTISLSGSYANIENVQMRGDDDLKNVTGNASANALVGGSGANILTGNDGNDTLLGGAGNDTLNGNNGNDYLDGGSGNDAMDGGANDDTYYVDSTSDTVTDASGNDTVNSLVSWTLSTSIEKLVLIAGAGNINGTGSTNANTILGNEGNNVLTGGGGADTMTGGAGNDTYFVDSIDDVVTENAGQGTDTVSSTITWTLGNNFENLTLTGASATNGIGNGSNNNINSQTSTGSNVLTGGLGDDIYQITVSATETDTVVENASEGSDTVYLNKTNAGAYTLAANLETLVLQGSTSFSATGNSLDNGMWGSSNTAANTLVGGLGNDYYVLGSNDTITENVSEGTDAAYIDNVNYTGVLSNVEYVYAYNSVTGLNDFTAGRTLVFTGTTTSLTITGSTFSDSITGGNGNDTINGNGGSDTLNGGLGNDSYYTDGGDTITEAAASGTDTVFSTGTYTLGAASNIENLTLTGSANVNAIGNAQDNVLTGNSGTNTLTGNDGNDTYIISTGDTISETSTVVTQIDTVQVDITYTLGANLENLTLIGSANINGTGNTLANSMTGNAGNNILDGLAGADTMAGGAGDDTYYVNIAGDVITEAASSGIDTAYTTVTYVIPTNVEFLIAAAASITLTGDANDNSFTSQAAATTMVGLGGNDLYVIDSADDVVTEASNAGVDKIRTSVNYNISANVEDIELVEGSAAANAVGNALDNTFIGNTNNTNTFTGQAGNDTYFVDATADTVVEAVNEGLDSVYSSATYTLAANVENLTLLGVATIDGTGNSLDNILTGNGGVNTLTGSGGNDTLAGGQGNDSLVGGAGNTTYIYNRGDAVDSINDTGGTDVLNFASSDISYTQLWLKHTGNDLEIDIIGTNDQVFVKNWYISTPANQIETINSGDGYTLNSSSVDQLVTAMAALTPPAFGQTGLDPTTYDSLELTFFNTWKAT